MEKKAKNKKEKTKIIKTQPLTIKEWLCFLSYNITYLVLYTDISIFDSRASLSPTLLLSFGVEPL